ncbi:MAG: lysophospholipid acyltransferase family protein [Kiritimatiellia bacterium]
MAEYLCRLLPRRFCYYIALRMADTFYRSDVRARRAVRANMRRVTGHMGQKLSRFDVELLVRRVFQGFAKYLVDFFSFSHMTREETERLVEFENRGQLEKVRALNRGALLVTAHHGNWELAGAVLVSLGYSITAVAQPQEQKKLNNLFMSYRRKRGIHVVPLGLTVVRQLMEALGRGEFVGLLADRDYTPRNHPIDFFGAPASLPIGPAWISSHYKVPILPGFLLRKEDDSFVMKFYPILNAAGDQDEATIQAELRDVLQDGISRDPSQWFMFEDLWNGNPYGGGYQ